MFILRKITVQGLQSNVSLGKSYNHVCKEINLNEFNAISEDVFKNQIDESVYAFITCDSGKSVYPLYSGQKNYIMTESGQTFSNVSKF